MQQSSFEILARRLRPDIVARTLAITHDAGLADDVAQDTLLRLWQLRDRLEQYRSVEALARVIARNLALDALRQRGATVSLDALTADLAAGEAEAADEALLTEEATGEIDRIMQQLAPAQQAVLRMRHAEGMEMDEIARVIGSTPANVRVLLCRARARVKDLYFKER